MVYEIVISLDVGNAVPPLKAAIERVNATLATLGDSDHVVLGTAVPFLELTSSRELTCKEQNKILAKIRSAIPMHVLADYRPNVSMRRKSGESCSQPQSR